MAGASCEHAGASHEQKSSRRLSRSRSGGGMIPGLRRSMAAGWWVSWRTRRSAEESSSSSSNGRGTPSTRTTRPNNVSAVPSSTSPSYHIQVDASSSDGSEDEDDEPDGSDLDGYGGAPLRQAPPASRRIPHSRLEKHPVATFVLTLSLGWLLGLFYVWPFPTTIHAVLPMVIALTAWTAIQWASIIQASCKSTDWTAPSVNLKWSRSRRIAVAAATILTLAILCNMLPPSERSIPLPELIPADPHVPERYFIAANLYNNEDVIPEWTTQVVRLCEHLGNSNCFLSIAESNSRDHTQSLLTDFDTYLTDINVPHRITMQNNTDRWWPYGTSPERISYLAGVRNKALEALQSEDDAVRLPDAHTFTKIIFLNDIYFSWQSIVRLLATRLDGRTDVAADYDLACALDYGAAGLYDTWVARDVCGAPLRTFWPYIKERQGAQRIRAEKPVEVAACWNGAVAMPAKPYIRQHAAPQLTARGWRMMDNASYEHSLQSPPVVSPLQFRGPSWKDPCDHSECFLHSYDIHRKLEGVRRPRIYMNPSVKVAYDLNWYRWQHTILRIPFIRFWQRIWSRGFPFWFVDWIYERLGRRADYCTWAGLQLADHCPPLEHRKDIGWENG